MRALAAALPLALLLAACGQPDTAARDAVKAPIDEAASVQATVDGQAQETKAAVDAPTDPAAAGATTAPAADAPATTPPP